MTSKSVFISGSASILQLNADFVVWLQNRVLAKDFAILIGDCPRGVDKLVQDLLLACPHRVTVYHSTARPRYLASESFATRRVWAQGEKGRAFYTVKDKAMSQDCDYAIAVSAGSQGTERNIAESRRRVSIWLFGR